MERQAERARAQRGWVRLALVIVYGGGTLAGLALVEGANRGWSQPLPIILACASFVFLVMGFVVARGPHASDGESPPLPGEVYGARATRNQREPLATSAPGGIPFGASKQVLNKRRSPKVNELYTQLEELNGQIQRAGVKMGLGQLSKEGYTLIVEDLKKKRADIERRITQAELGLASGAGGQPAGGH